MLAVIWKSVSGHWQVTELVKEAYTPLDKYMTFVRSCSDIQGMVWVTVLKQAT